MLKFNHKIKGGIIIERFLTLRQFAKKQGISIPAARELRRKGLPTIKPSGIIKVDMEKAPRWLKEYKGANADAITYKVAAKLAGMRVGKLRQLARASKTFNAVLIEGKTQSKISKKKFLEWARINISQ